MSVARKIARNTALLMIASLFTNIMALVWTIYTARYLGTAGFGTLSAALALTGIFSVLADLGMSTYATREVARDNEKTRKLLGNIALIKCFLAVITVSLLYITVLFKEISSPISKRNHDYRGIHAFHLFYRAFQCHIPGPPENGVPNHWKHN